MNDQARMKEGKGKEVHPTLRRANSTLHRPLLLYTALQPTPG